MPSSIPYDHPSLVLGNIADTRVLALLKKIAALQAKIDASQDKMNSFIMMKRSLSMTMNELIDMNVDVTDIKTKITELDASVTAAATDYMTSRMTNETSIQQLREQVCELDGGDTMESPVDFTLSTIKHLPLSAESLKLDAQYFSYGSNQDDDTVASIEKYIKESNSDLGSQGAQIAKTATAQINQQRQNHSLAGTLIITASCTHRNVTLIDPLVIDADKAIDVWNSIYTDDGDRIKTTDPSVVKTMSEENSPSGAEKSLSILSGASYGSSFTGMVHILKTDMSATGLLQEDIDQMQEKIKMGGWLEDVSGGFGVDPSVMEEVKKILNTQKVTSHVSIIVMGAVPSIASNKLISGLSKISQPDPAKMNPCLSAISQPSSSAGTPGSSANAARAGNQVLSLQQANTQSIMQGLGKIDHGDNNVIDINSMMMAFENYVTSIKARDESVGAPINFYMKKITRQQLAKCWIDKYFPGIENKAIAT